jgi:hypothetical protein
LQPITAPEELVSRTLDELKVTFFDLFLILEKVKTAVFGRFTEGLEAKRREFISPVLTNSVRKYYFESNVIIISACQENHSEIGCCKD